MSVGPLCLIGIIAGRRVAIDAGLVESVIELAGVRPVPGAARGILGLAALRSRVLTVVDCAVALGLGAASATGNGSSAPLPAIVLTVGGYLYGFVLDKVEDVVEADGPAVPAGAPLGDPWTAVSAGIVDISGITLPLLEPAAVLATLTASAA